MNTKHIFAAISCRDRVGGHHARPRRQLGRRYRRRRRRWIGRRSFRDVRHEPRSVRSRGLPGPRSGRRVARQTHHCIPRRSAEPSRRAVALRRPRLPSGAPLPKAGSTESTAAPLKVRNASATNGATTWRPTPCFQRPNAAQASQARRTRTAAAGPATRSLTGTASLTARAA